jgi:hypothetical protein
LDIIFEVKEEEELFSNINSPFYCQNEDFLEFDKDEIDSKIGSYSINSKLN